MFSASLTFFLITWRRHLLSKNSQSSVRGDEVGKCTVRSACFLVPEAGSIQPKIPDRSKTRLAAIHSTKNQTGPIGKSGPPQKVDQFLRSFFWTEISGNFLWMDRAPEVSAYEIEMISSYHVWSAIDCLWYQPGSISFRNRLPTVPS